VMIIIFYFDHTLVWLMVGYLIIYYFIATLTRKKAIATLKESNAKDEEVSGLWYEIVGNIRSVKVLGMATKIREYGSTLTLEYLQKAYKRIFQFQLSGFYRGLWGGFVRVALLVFVTWQIIHGHYEVGFLVLFN